uniref:Uncharacterized protein n=1 Tax=Candidatus Kentrum sp. SD TaxID=2126332 RepID=A0A451BS46_9GAMM|nr:MAG: hypothetical protein BECKSD772F_GA0070984_10827 [Candidatus Kentron sp. SD]VFK46770.1 MAG: hypothetical protein BECKSD772E_GA0070983_10807 [Candidatus Kentron sp. SD]VFK81133.1 MAG: hypothetical protein BECKSD772D_GA0070982_12313 [Candidatus Kentron sp. SD]
MAEIDKLKEEIGWMKMLFGILIVSNISLIARIAQNYNRAPEILLLIGIVGVLSITIGIAWLNKSAYRRINKLRALHEPSLARQSNGSRKM